MIILCPTMMHSGSHALWYGVMKSCHPIELEAVKQGKIPTYDKDHGIILNHVLDSHMAQWESLIKEGHPIVTTMRHPTRILSSHMKRNEIDTRWMLWYAQQQANHAKLYRYNKPYLIHVDQPELRDKQIQSINKDLGLNLEHTWEISLEMGCKSNTHGKLDEIHSRMTPKAYIEYYEETVNAEKAQLR